MTNIVRPSFSRIKPFVANVIFDAECSMWVATCHALHVVTEAPGYEALVARFLEIAPEIALENGIVLNDASHIEFRHVEAAASRLTM